MKTLLTDYMEFLKHILMHYFAEYTHDCVQMVSTILSWTVIHEVTEYELQ